MSSKGRNVSPGIQINGMLLLDKPSGMTSNAVLQRARHLLNSRKAGHTGTLDPIATGLLPLCFGKATRVAGFFLDFDKSYRITLKLGIGTDTGDREGRIIQTSRTRIAFSDVEAALERFRGPILQVPPMFSAIKHKGKPLYKLARSGVEIAREARKVTVHKLDIISYDRMQLVLDVSCSKGFYVRSMAADLGHDLKCGAHVEELRRTAVGEFSVEKAVTLDQLEAMETPERRKKRLVGVDAAVKHLPRVLIPDIQVSVLCAGQRISVPGLEPWSGLARLYAPHDRFIGLGIYIPGGAIQPRRVFDVPG